MNTLEIIQDPDPMNPRTECDNVTTMVCFHKRYDLGDPYKDHGYSRLDFNGWDELEKRIRRDHKPIDIIPLFLYDHSGLTISTSSFSCPWDSGQIGFIFVSKKQADEESGRKSRSAQKKWALRAIASDVEMYDQYLRGDVHGYEIRDPAGDVLDSCWGIFGLDEATSEGQSALDRLNAEEAKNTPPPLPGMEAFISDHFIFASVP